MSHPHPTPPCSNAPPTPPYPPHPTLSHPSHLNLLSLPRPTPRPAPPLQDVYFLNTTAPNDADWQWRRIPAPAGLLGGVTACTKLPVVNATTGARTHYILSGSLGNFEVEDTVRFSKLVLPASGRLREVSLVSLTPPPEHMYVWDGWGVGAVPRATPRGSSPTGGKGGRCTASHHGGAAANLARACVPPPAVERGGAGYEVARSCVIARHLMWHHRRRYAQHVSLLTDSKRRRVVATPGP
jgi:hypothetical protein